MKTGIFVCIYFSLQKDNLTAGIQSNTNMAVSLKALFYNVYFKHTKQVWYQHYSIFLYQPCTQVLYYIRS